MSGKEFRRLQGFQSARQNAPSWHGNSRRRAKSQGNGTGMVLKGTRIVHEVALETIFIPRIIGGRLSPM